jgi:tRNA U34 2-thiouridine synthase MnmA/TrmU
MLRVTVGVVAKVLVPMGRAEKESVREVARDMVRVA